MEQQLRAARREQICEYFGSVPRKVLPLGVILCEQALLLEEGLDQPSASAWPSVPVKYGSLIAGGRHSFDIHRLQPMLGNSFTLQHPGSPGCPYYSYSRTLLSFCLLIHVACERTVTSVCYVNCLSSLAVFRAVVYCDCARLDVVYHSKSNWLWMNHEPLFPAYRTATGQKPKNKPKTLESGISRNSVYCQLTLTFNY